LIKNLLLKIFHKFNMATLSSPCGPAKIWKKQYEKNISYCFKNGIYYIKNICQVF